MNMLLIMIKSKLNVVLFILLKGNSYIVLEFSSFEHIGTGVSYFFEVIGS